MLSVWDSYHNLKIKFFSWPSEKNQNGHLYYLCKCFGDRSNYIAVRDYGSSHCYEVWL